MPHFCASDPQLSPETTVWVLQSALRRRANLDDKVTFWNRLELVIPEVEFETKVELVTADVESDDNVEFAAS
jgi:hypothetical protein